METNQLLQNRIAEYKRRQFIFDGGDGQLYLQRCPACESENYMPAVATGMCAFCGFDANGNEIDNLLHANQ